MTTNVQNNKETCQFCMLGSICMSPAQREQLLSKLNVIVKKSQTLHRKELLYSYKDPFQCIYVINEGVLKTFQVDMDGQERIHHFYLPGEIVGLEAIHAGYYPYSAVALTETTVCQVPYEQLLDVVSQQAHLQRHFISSMSYCMNVGHYVTAAAAEQRLASFILDMAKRLNHATNKNVVELPMSRNDIGNYLRLAPETVSRILARFQQSKLIQINNKKITLLDEVNLEWMAKDGVNAH